MTQWSCYYRSIKLEIDPVMQYRIRKKNLTILSPETKTTTIAEIENSISDDRASDRLRWSALFHLFFFSSWDDTQAHTGTSVNIGTHWPSQEKSFGVTSTRSVHYTLTPPSLPPYPLCISKCSHLSGLWSSLWLNNRETQTRPGQALLSVTQLMHPIHTLQYTQKHTAGPSHPNKTSSSAVQWRLSCKPIIFTELNGDGGKKVENG